MSRIKTLVHCVVLLTGITAVSGSAFSETDRALKDPTRPPDFSQVESTSVQGNKTPGFVLNAIFIAEGRQVAVINGEPVQTGDQVNSAEVLLIFGDRVVLREAAGELVLRLVKSPVRSSEGANQ